MIDIPVIVPHCRRLVERRESIIRQFDGLFANYKFYEEYDAVDLNQVIKDQYYGTDFDPQVEKLKLWLPQPHKPRLLNDAEISLTIKHYEIYKQLAAGDVEVALILEDDVLLCDGFENRFNEYLANTPSDYDVIFMGCCWGLRPPDVRHDKVAYRKAHPASKCTDSYLITKSACQRLASTFLPFHLCIDFEMAYHMYEHDMKVYWWEPALVTQGSENGTFRSELR